MYHNFARLLAGEGGPDDVATDSENNQVLQLQALHFLILMTVQFRVRSQMGLIIWILGIQWHPVFHQYYYAWNAGNGKQATKFQLKSFPVLSIQDLIY